MGTFYQYLNSIAVIILVSMHLLGATEESELYQELRDALLTKDNIFQLQQAFYPGHSTFISESEINLKVTVKSIKENGSSDCLAFYFNEACECFQRNPIIFDSLQISSYSRNLEAYLSSYMHMLKYFDVTFFKLLTKVGYKVRNSYGVSSYAKLSINIKSLTTNPSEYTYEWILVMLFQWVSYYLSHSLALFCGIPYKLITLGERRLLSSGSEFICYYLNVYSPGLCSMFAKYGRVIQLL